MTAVPVTADSDSHPDPDIAAAETAAVAAAPNLRQQGSWAATVRTALTAIADSQERTAIAALIAEPTEGLVFVDAEEMVTLARARYQATQAVDRLEFNGLVNSKLPSDAHERAALLRDEFTRFWRNPPSAVRALDADTQQLILAMHERALTSAGAWVMLEDGLDAIQGEHGIFLPSRRPAHVVSGVKLHVSARGTTEMVELLARAVAVLTPGTNLKVATDYVLGKANSADPVDGRPASNQERKAITIYLPVGISERELVPLLRALTVDRPTDLILGEPEITPGVFMRGEHHIRFRDGVDLSAYNNLYRSAGLPISEADADARAVLAERPDLVAPFTEMVGLGGIRSQVDPRLALVLAAFGFDSRREPRWLRWELDGVGRAFGLLRNEGYGSWVYADGLEQAAQALAARKALHDQGVALDTLEPIDRDALTAEAIISGDARRVLEDAFAAVPELAMIQDLATLAQELASGIAPAPDTEPARIIDVEPVPALEPEPAPVFDTEPVIDAEPAPVTDTQPAPVIDAEPVPALETEPARIIDAKPVPALEPEPAPVTDTQPAPVIDAVPTPALETDPAPVIDAAPVASPVVVPVASPVVVPVAESNAFYEITIDPSRVETTGGRVTPLPVPAARKTVTGHTLTEAQARVVDEIKRSIAAEFKFRTGARRKDGAPGRVYITPKDSDPRLFNQMMTGRMLEALGESAREGVIEQAVDSIREEWVKSGVQLGLRAELAAVANPELVTTALTELGLRVSDPLSVGGLSLS